MKWEIIGTVARARGADLRRCASRRCSSRRGGAGLVVLVGAVVQPLKGIRERARQNKPPAAARSAGLRLLLAPLFCSGTYFRAVLLTPCRVWRWMSA
jgi:hypothetical protein